MRYGLQAAQPLGGGLAEAQPVVVPACVVRASRFGWSVPSPYGSNPSPSSNPKPMNPMLATPALGLRQRALVSEVVRPLDETRVASLHPAAAQVVAVHPAEGPPLLTTNTTPLLMKPPLALAAMGLAAMGLAQRSLGVHVLAHVRRTGGVLQPGYTHGHGDM